METWLTTLAWGFAALLAVPCPVVLWEHGQAQHRASLSPPGTHRAMQLDVTLDAWLAEGDQAVCQTALGGAPTTAAMTQGCAETKTMVAIGLVAVEPLS